MSVSVTGTTSLEPFLQPRPGEPIGTLIGLAGLAGDASGGTASLLWVLGSFIYVFRAVTLRLVVGVGETVHMEISTGYADAAADDIVGKTQEVPAAGAGLDSYAEWEPPQVYCTPRDRSVAIIIELLNPGAGITMTASFRALVFPEGALQTTPTSALARFLL